MPGNRLRAFREERGGNSSQVADKYWLWSRPSCQIIHQIPSEWTGTAARQIPPFPDVSMHFSPPLDVIMCDLAFAYQRALFKKGALLVSLLQFLVMLSLSDLLEHWGGGGRERSCALKMLGEIHSLQLRQTDSE